MGPPSTLNNYELGVKGGKKTKTVVAPGVGAEFHKYSNELPFRTASIISPRCPDASVSSSILDLFFLFGSLTAYPNL